MIQRRQTLFLLELVFLAVALLFIPSQHLRTGTIPSDIYLVPINEPGLQSTTGHIAAVTINFVGIIVSFITIFLYKNRSVQVKLSYLLTFIWVIITAMIAFCPFAKDADKSTGLETNYFAVAIGIFGIIAGILAARFIKKDIELLKSADRIR
jgi:hypothetical protein